MQPATEEVAEVSRDIARKVLQIESQAIAELADRVDEDFERALQLLCQCEGRVVVTGMGKSGIICQKIAATLSSTGRVSLLQATGQPSAGYYLIQT